MFLQLFWKDSQKNRLMIQLFNSDECALFLQYNGFFLPSPNSFIALPRDVMVDLSAEYKAVQGLALITLVVMFSGMESHASS